jgi:hypothetical protein
VIQGTPFFHLIRRLIGLGRRPGFDAGEVFRGFADGVERRIADGHGGRPKVRVPLTGTGGGRPWR